MGSLGEGAARGRLFNPRINFRAVGRIHEDATAAPILSQSALLFCENPLALRILCRCAGGKVESIYRI